MLKRLRSGNWRLTVIRAQLLFSAALNGVLLALILVTVPALNLIAFTIAGVSINGALFLMLRRWPTAMAPIVIFNICIMIVALIGLDLSMGSPQIAIWVGLTVTPMFAIFFVGPRLGLPFYLLTCATLLGLTLGHGDVPLLIPCATLGITTFSTGICWLAESARLQAEEESRVREAALQVKAREALAASEAKSMFLATMSHEIRTPMNGVLGLTRMLLETELSQTQRALGLKTLQSGQSLMGVLNDVLDVSRLESGRMDFSSEPLQPERLVREVCDLLQPDSAALTLAVHSTNGLPPWVMGSPKHLRQILTNLLNNALKFTPDGTVEVSLRFDEGLHIEVSDTGIGIPSDKIGALFDAFTQADSSTTRAFGGSGLGLAICKRLCEGMGGEIGVDSEPGVGSTFWFRLPFQPCDAPKQSERPHLPDGVRVLVAEDHPVNQIVVKRALESFGCEVLVVENGALAVEQLKRGQWDLVLMDCYMPVMDGFDATQAIRALEGPLARTPVLALTASSNMNDHQRVFEVGMNALMTKPLQPDLLRDTIAENLTFAA